MANSDYQPSCSRTVTTNASSDEDDCIYVYCSSRSDSDSDRARLSSPKPKKAKKLQGAATYKTNFRSAWTKEYPFISSVHGDPFRLAEIVRHSGLYCGYIL